jgi:hypothetical protein
MAGDQSHYPDVPAINTTRSFEKQALEETLQLLKYRQHRFYYEYRANVMYSNEDTMRALTKGEAPSFSFVSANIHSTQVVLY